MENILWFREIYNTDVGKVGGKGASLGEMYNADIPVPPGFCVTAGAYGYFLDITGLKEKITKVLKNIDINDTNLLEKKAKEVRDMILLARMPDDIRKDIEEAYSNLNVDENIVKHGNKNAMDIVKSGRDSPYVAVRSSATAEDLPDFSFAGQQETFLNVKGQKQLIISVQKCWASLFTGRAVYYRIKNDFDHMKVLISVVIQKMVNSTTSGIMFTINPSTNAENEIVIEAGFGLGEAIVSGSVNPDNYIIDKKSLEIKHKKVNKQDWKLIRDDSFEKTVKINLKDSEANLQKMNDKDIVNLAKLGVLIEEHYDKPMDIEFALEGSRIYIVQARPVTTLNKEKKNEENGESNSSSGKILVRGLGASPGIRTGKVKIVNDMDELDKVEKGDILVTKMTNPDFVVAMERASAIVTDEGGTTCFSGDTKVLTSDGFMEIKDASELIKSGEEVILLAYDAKNMKPVWKKVISSGKRKSNVVRISVSQTGKMDENTLDLTENHKMITFENRELIKKEIKNILKDNEYPCLIDSLPETLKVNDEKLAYVIGALLADGYVKVDKHSSGNPRRGNVIFTQKNIIKKEAFIDGVKQYFEECFGESFNDGRIKSAPSIIKGRIVQGDAYDYTCSKLRPALFISQIFNNLDYWALRLDEYSSLNFLAGLIDGDGCLYENRLHIYVGKENVLQGVILACLSLGIIPQITKNRNINHVQIVERISDILDYTKRVKGAIKERSSGTKLFSAKQLLGDIIDEVNYKGRIKPYVNNNLLIDKEKISKNIIVLASFNHKQELIKILNSNLRMQRVKQICNIGEIEVYNLEIEADNELDHNFVVFTKKYSPILVSNSHAAIVSRELGVPAVVGTENATSVLKDGMIITVNGSKGEVYEGSLSFVKESLQGKKTEEINYQEEETSTRVKVICDLASQAERASLMDADGIGLVRIEFMIAENGIHPAYYIKMNREDEYEQVLYDGLKEIAIPFNGKPIWVRTSDIRTDEYRNLTGGDDEPHESNPMIGWHGIRRGLDEEKILETEFKAIKRLHDEGHNNVGVMIPFVISVEEIRKAKEIMRRIGLEPVHDIDFGVMVETPASVWIIDKLCEEGISFVSFGTNDLTQTTLGIDRGNDRIQKSYSELHLAVLRSIEHVIKTCRKYNVETSICGQAGSNPEMVKYLVHYGIDSISANIDAVHLVRKVVAREERRLLLESARKNIKN